MDLSANTIRWMRSYEYGTETEYIEGLALNPAEDKVAVYARKGRNSDVTIGTNEGYLFVIASKDGGIVSKRALKIAHGDSLNNIGFLTSSDSMYFSADDKVWMTWWISMASPTLNQAFSL